MAPHRNSALSSCPARLATTQHLGYREEDKSAPRRACGGHGEHFRLPQASAHTSGTSLTSGMGLSGPLSANCVHPIYRNKETGLRPWRGRLSSGEIPSSRQA